MLEQTASEFPDKMALAFEGYILKQFPPDPPSPEITFDDNAMYQYTGGTTGISKGAILTHGSLSSQVQHLEAWFPRFKRGEGIVLGALPFFHVFGLTTTMNFALAMGWGDIFPCRWEMLCILILILYYLEIPCMIKASKPGNSPNLVKATSKIITIRAQLLLSTAQQ